MRQRRLTDTPHTPTQTLTEAANAGVATSNGVDSLPATVCPAARQWPALREKLRGEFGDSAFASWIKPISFDAFTDGHITLAVPTRFMRDWVATHYSEKIRALWSQDLPELRSVMVVVKNAPPRSEESLKLAPVAGVQAPQFPTPSATLTSRTNRPIMPVVVSVAPSSAPSVSDLSATLDPRYTFDSFVVGKPNEFAYAAARRVADSLQPSFNPLFLYGGVGLGKTHLMHAIAWGITAQHPTRRVVYLSAEKFMYSFVRAMLSKDTITFKEQLRSVDVLLIDDVQFISGKDSTQEEFFHTFNALVDQGRQVVLSADKSPSDLDDISERLRSRLASGLVADIHPTTYELRLSILESKLPGLAVDIPPKVLEFLAHKITSNVRELEGALIRLAAHAQLVGRAITLEAAQDVLKDLLRASERRVSVEDIQKKVAEHFKIKLKDMLSARRDRQVARPRQVAMYLTKQLTSRSLPEIGRRFDNRDHTTVIHAVRKVEELMEIDSAFAEDVELLRRMLES